MSNKWNLVSGFPPLEAGEAHLWRIDLTNVADLADRYTSLLSASEQADANRRRIGQVRDHFIIGRACSRILIGSALRMNPSKVNIVNGIHGKPEIPAINGHGISFNLAHSKETLLIALRRQGSVGVDVEYFDRSTDIMEVALANFTENESNSLAAVEDPKARLRTFYSYWTRKEAVGKADGRGLLVPLASFDVSFESMNSHPVHVNDSPDKEPKLYFVSDLDLGDKAAGALALESSDARIRSLIFPLQSSSW
jgi:4'-phosphopantetheinyl transferase